MNLTISRETAYTALLTRMQTIASLKTCTRKLTHWNDVPAEDQPALYIAIGSESRQVRRGLPPLITLEVQLWVYVSTNGEEVGPLLNPVLDAIDLSLQPKQTADNVQTLDGVVHHCWIEGVTQIFEGNLGTEAVAIIPVRILIS